jgi:uncharacterized protein (DUF2252 family)
MTTSTAKRSANGKVARIADTGLSTREELIERGRGLRKAVPRSSHGDWAPEPDRPDPVELLEISNRTRVPDLVPIRYGRMLHSPFTFFRGAPAVMSWDLSRTPSTGIYIQACGDAHLLNFGGYGTPERRLVFDVNDFDESLPAPWEWDLKRLLASIVIAARTAGFEAREAEMTMAGARAYARQMARLTSMTTLDIRYALIDVDELAFRSSDPVSRKALSDFAAMARTHTTLQALDKLTAVVDGRRVIVDHPPLIVRSPDPQMPELVREFLRRYKQTLSDDRRHLLDQYHVVDVARKVVGVGSVGLEALIVLLQGRAARDPLFLQVKQAEASVLEAYAGRSAYPRHGRRVVAGQRLVQATSDLFLGWSVMEGQDFYVRQLRDMKGTIDLDRTSAEVMVRYAAICGATLARAHARSAGPGLITGYIGDSDRFATALVAFAQRYADQVQLDYAALVEAAATGRIHTVEGR